MSSKPIFRSPKTRAWRRVRIAAALLLLAWIAMAVWHNYKPLPEGLSAEMPLRSVDGLRFLADYSWVDARGRRQIEQRIFDRVLELIDQAERVIVIDMFLFNHFAGNPDGPDMRPLSAEVTDALIRRKREAPELRAILITDPINHFYGSLDLELFDRLRNGGVEVVITELKKLRASNPAWSGIWRLCCQWFGRADDGGWLPNPVGDQQVSMRSVLELLNFKANHRKTLVVDSAAGWTGMVTSGNAHDASSAHSNIAIEFSGPAALDLLATEAAVAEFSAPGLDWPEVGRRPIEHGSTAGTRIQVLTEAAIRDALLASLERAGQGDRIDLAMFYLSHRSTIEALIAAQARGARVRVVLDPNEGAFGREKSGIPNRSVAAELTDAGVRVRWCNTTGEQCHDKAVAIHYANGRAELIAGSANFTRRNLDDLNLETNVRVVAHADAEVVADFDAYFDRRWNNRPGETYSRPYPAFAKEGWFRYWRYRFMEFTGLSTF
ncbi:MAG: phospholipase D family protein [Wenzhouxiangellaceae bacterium]|nr:phospholipase D family protein [Wenzhouxiangellaceae bacterium]MBS3822382.1 phospholipase D family protein [Wenzhouxiangellaceae bacterium]